MVDITVKLLLIWIRLTNDAKRYNFWLKYKKYVFSNFKVFSAVTVVHFCDTLSDFNPSSIFKRIFKQINV